MHCLEFVVRPAVCFVVGWCICTNYDRAGLPQGFSPAEVSFLGLPKGTLWFCPLLDNPGDNLYGDIVNNRQMVEVAALVSAHSQHVITGPERLPAGALEKFWDRSQRRLKLWLSALTHYQRRSAQIDPLEHDELWSDLEPILGEIFVSEVLTRVWGAILVAMDQERATHFTEAIARNVLIGHLDARKRALQLLVTDPALTIEKLAPIDSIRRRVERWTDLLLGHLIERYQVDDFAFDPSRAREFGAQQLLQTANGTQDRAWTLLLIGLQTSFSTTPVGPPNDLIQEEIIASILACFPPGAFQPEGPFRPIIADRIVRPNSTTSPIAQPAAPASDVSPNSSLTSSKGISFHDLRHRYPPLQG